MASGAYGSRHVFPTLSFFIYTLFSCIFFLLLVSARLFASVLFSETLYKHDDRLDFRAERRKVKTHRLPYYFLFFRCICFPLCVFPVHNFVVQMRPFRQVFISIFFFFCFVKYLTLATILFTVFVTKHNYITFPLTVKQLFCMQ